ncbi:unnamed protein product [Adineta ricciae]|uniref:Uncharacterized protein n=1 Tax=Adineta ricciae TaxID=249248 RepID=A0A814P5D9_ADIRI|nr:unnamed protein product [Adineta ricciae]
MHRAQKEMEEAALNNRPTTATTTTSSKPHVTQPVVNKQKQLLSGIVKRKTNETLKRPLEEATEEDTSAPPARLPRLLVPGGRLPGIGPAEGFSDSSDSNESSDDDGLSRHSNSIGLQTSIAQRKKLAKQLQDLAAASAGNGD